MRSKSGSRARRLHTSLFDFTRFKQAPETLREPVHAGYYPSPSRSFNAESFPVCKPALPQYLLESGAFCRTPIIRDCLKEIYE
jgi:hypothetical protein